MAKQFFDHTLEDALRENGMAISCLWQIKNPVQNMAGMEGLMVNGRVFLIVQTFADGFGWQALMSNDSNRIDATVAAVMERVRALTPASVEA